MKAPARPPRKGSWSKPLADFVGKVIDPVMARQGFGQSDIIMHWGDIVGPRFAAVSQPLRLQWPPRGRARSPEAAVEPATLIVRVEGGFALELQHLAPLLIERINGRLGWRCVGKLAFRQGPVSIAAPRRVRPAPPNEDAVRRAGETTATIEDEALRGALTRLGARILSRPRAKS
jgi:hypothetical protein